MQNWSQRLNFSLKMFLLPVITANRNIFPNECEEEGVEARVGSIQNSEPQDFKFHFIFSAVIVFLGLMCCPKEQVKTASIFVSNFTQILL